METCLILTCPHCRDDFVIETAELACRILRHFAFFDYQQLNPHADQAECERVVREGLGFGCAGPIEIVQEGDKWVAVKCEYK